MTENDEELEAALMELEVAMDRREYTSVLKLSTEWVQRHPDCSELYFRRAHARLLVEPRSPDLSGAVEDVTFAVELDTDEPAYRFFRGLWRFELGESKGAVSDLQEAISLEAKLGSAYYIESARLLLALSLQSIGEVGEARREAGQLPRDASFYARGRMWTVHDVEK